MLYRALRRSCVVTPRQRPLSAVAGAAFIINQNLLLSGSGSSSFGGFKHSVCIFDHFVHNQIEASVALLEPDRVKELYGKYEVLAAQDLFDLHGLTYELTKLANKIQYKDVMDTTLFTTGVTGVLSDFAFCVLSGSLCVLTISPLIVGSASLAKRFWKYGFKQPPFFKNKDEFYLALMFFIGYIILAVAGESLFLDVFNQTSSNVYYGWKEYMAARRFRKHPEEFKKAKKEIIDFLHEKELSHDCARARARAT